VAPEFAAAAAASGSISAIAHRIVKEEIFIMVGLVRGVRRMWQKLRGKRLFFATAKRLYRRRTAVS